MKTGMLKKLIMKVTTYLEIILAIFISAAVVISIVDLSRYMVLIVKTNPIDTYELFQMFLGHVLLLVVGVELVAMLVTHTPGSVIEVLLYAVARNMLIGSKQSIDFMLGIAAIAGIFAIRKYLFLGSMNQSEAVNVFPAAAAISEINSAIDVNIPENLGYTIGGVICHLSKQTCRKLHEGAVFHVADAEVRVLDYKDGVIQRVSVVKLNNGQIAK